MITMEQTVRLSQRLNHFVTGGCGRGCTSLSNLPHNEWIDRLMACPAAMNAWLLRIVERATKDVSMFREAGKLLHSFKPSKFDDLDHIIRCLKIDEPYESNRFLGEGGIKNSLDFLSRVTVAYASAAYYYVNHGGAEYSDYAKLFSSCAGVFGAKAVVVAGFGSQHPCQSITCRSHSIFQDEEIFLSILNTLTETETRQQINDAEELWKNFCLSKTV